MKLTLNKIKKHDPCNSGWKTLLKSMNKTEADNVEFNLIDVLNSNGIKDAIWCLRCFDYLDYCLFLADIAESVLHIYESKHDNKAPRKAIQGIRDYKLGKITAEELKVLAYAAAYAAYAAADDAASSSAYAAAFAAYAAADVAATSAYATDAYNGSWDEIEILFIKHFGE